MYFSKQIFALFLGRYESKVQIVCKIYNIKFYAYKNSHSIIMF